MTNLKKLSKELVLAIDWAAAEYKYLEELKGELKEAEKENGNVHLRKACSILRYVGKAERRAFHFEQKVGKDIHSLLREKNISADLISGFQDFIQQFDIEQANLLQAADIFHGTLKKGLVQAEVDKEVEERLSLNHPEKAKIIYLEFLKVLKSIEEQVDDAVKWVDALQASLRKAKYPADRFMDSEKKYARDFLERNVREAWIITKKIVDELRRIIQERWVKGPQEQLVKGRWFKWEEDPTSFYNEKIKTYLLSLTPEIVQVHTLLSLSGRFHENPLVNAYVQSRLGEANKILAQVNHWLKEAHQFEEGEYLYQFSDAHITPNSESKLKTMMTYGKGNYPMIRDFIASNKFYRASFGDIISQLLYLKVIEEALLGIQHASSVEDLVRKKTIDINTAALGLHSTDFTSLKSILANEGFFFMSYEGLRDFRAKTSDLNPDLGYVNFSLKKNDERIGARGYGNVMTMADHEKLRNNSTLSLLKSAQQFIFKKGNGCRGYADAAMRRILPEDQFIYLKLHPIPEKAQSKDEIDQKTLEILEKSPLSIDRRSNSPKPVIIFKPGFRSEQVILLIPRELIYLGQALKWNDEAVAQVRRDNICGIILVDPTPNRLETLKMILWKAFHGNMAYAVPIYDINGKVLWPT